MSTRRPAPTPRHHGAPATAQPHIQVAKVASRQPSAPHTRSPDGIPTDQRPRHNRSHRVACLIITLYYAVVQGMRVHPLPSACQRYAPKPHPATGTHEVAPHTRSPAATPTAQRLHTSRYSLGCSAPSRYIDMSGGSQHVNVLAAKVALADAPKLHIFRIVAF